MSTDGAAAARAGVGVDRGLVEIYLGDHLAGARAGVDRSARMAAAYADTPIGAELGEIAERIASDRAELLALVRSLGFRVSRWKSAVAWTGERLGRLKLNGRWVRPSPLSALLELELLQSAVVGKRGVWESLLAWSDALGLDEGRVARLRELIDDADAQRERSARLAARVRRTAFRVGE